MNSDVDTTESKQQTLMKLVSTHPALLEDFDENLLASLTLSSSSSTHSRRKMPTADPMLSSMRSFSKVKLYADADGHTTSASFHVPRRPGPDRLRALQPADQTRLVVTPGKGGAKGSGKDIEKPRACERSISTGSTTATDSTDTECNGNGRHRKRKQKEKDKDHLLLDHRCFVARDQWVPHAARRSCYVCLRDFSMLRKKHSCRMCGDVICSRCSVFKRVDLPLVDNKMRICSCCFFAYRKKLDESSDDVAAAVAVPAPATALPVVAAEISTDAIAVPATLVDDDNNKHVNDLLNCARNTEEELEAVRHAKELEKQVAASRERIQELEGRIASHEELQRQAKLSLEQQAQLRDARAMIQSLQAQLREQEESAQEAVRTRDTLCLSKMRQTEVFSNDDDESRALKQKLRVLERQLQQAGINVAEVIPYDVARAKVTEISRAMAAIGSSEVVLVDKQAQTKARKQYYILEQQMEKYNTALLMTDEYVAEQARIQAAWEAQHAATNARSAQLLRGAMPVEIARLSEHDLRTMKTPSGVPFPPDLARRLKRTNVLQLLRVDPTTITKMHPSVITNLRTNGLSLLERRALHHALLKPSKDWAKQQKEELSARKYAWFTKLKEALAQGLRSLEAHCQGLDIDVYADDISHVCSAVGTACPVRAEQKVLQLYACGLGFSMDEVFAAQEILKSDAEGAGEKARLEAQAHAREMVTNHRQRELKKHYRTNMRLVALALGALEEADALRERVVATDDSFITLDDDRDKLQSVTTLLQDSRELLWLLAKRAGICLTGKRDPTRDSEDDRSELEGQAAMDAVAMLTLVVEDVQGFLASHRASAGACVGMLQAVKQLLQDVDAKNTALNERLGAKMATNCKRVAWSLRERPVESKMDAKVAYASEQGGPGGVPTPMPTSAKMFDAIRARRKSVDKRDGPVVASSPAIPRANDLFAAIRARKKAAAAAASSNVEAALAQSA